MPKNFREISDDDMMRHFEVEDASHLDIADLGPEGEDKVEKKIANKKERERESEIDISKVKFSNHAISQFIERSQKLGMVIKQDPEMVARKLLENAISENAINSVFRVKRLIGHGFKEMMYYQNTGWRFVVKEENGVLVVVTIERVKPSQN